MKYILYKYYGNNLYLVMKGKVHTKLKIPSLFTYSSYLNTKEEIMRKRFNVFVLYAFYLSDTRAILFIALQT